MPSMQPITPAPQVLLASIHDVSPRFEREVDILAELFTRQLGAPRFAMLVVPDHWGKAPLREAAAFQGRLRNWAEAGVEMFVHGWFHRDFASHAGLARFKARHMTAGEGEFLGLGQTEAARRMNDGKALIEDVIGRPVAGFIAPAWLYGEGAHAAMRELGNEARREVGRHANNRVENSHLPFRRRERAIQRFRRLKSLQKFASVHASFHNHFNQDRHLISREGIVSPNRVTGIWASVILGQWPNRPTRSVTSTARRR